MKNPPKIVLIGAGNVGFHLGKKLHDEGINILQVFSRKKSKAKKLGKIISCDFTSDFSKIHQGGDLYILAVPDSVIGQVAQNLSKEISAKKLVVHTSGATPSTVLKPHFKNYGIFYPLQTFSIAKKVDFQNIPVCVDSNLKKHRSMLFQLGEMISQKVYHINDRERAILHVAAVFVNNFSNNLFAIGEKITSEEKVPFEILKPLIEETVNKIQNHNAANMQTGPAKRGDHSTIERHLKYLEKNFPDFIEVYKTMTKSINPKIL